MTDSFLQALFAERIGGARYGKDEAIYKFEKIKRAKAAAREAHPDVPLIDMGVGEPDSMAAPEVVEALKEAAALPENRGYSDNGGMAFREAAARYMGEVMGVPGIDPQRGIVHSIGSKSALSILPACFINPGDYTLMTVPGYPVFGTHARYYGGEIFNLALTPENNFLPMLESVPNEVLRRAKVLVLNYPNNPTGASASRDFFQRVVDFAKQHELIVIQDAAYAALTFDGEPPLSILSLPGAMDVALELHSLSKTFNMTGWRLGWVTGNPLLVRAYADVKDNTDSGQFLGIQAAGVAALARPEITRRTAQKYARRLRALAQILRGHGFPAEAPRAGFFIYVKAPSALMEAEGGETLEMANAAEVADRFIRELLISTVPWDEAGAFLRFSATFEAEDEAAERAVLAEIDRRLGRFQYRFD